MDNDPNSAFIESLLKLARALEADNFTPQ